jgi:hypothetical protein
MSKIKQTKKNFFVFVLSVEKLERLLKMLSF